MKQFTFFIFAGGGGGGGGGEEGFRLGNAVCIIIEVFYFCFPLPTVKIAKLK